MILTEDKHKLAQADSTPEGPPPSYTDAGAHAGPSTQRALPEEPLPDVQATNFLVISKKHDSVKGTFVIDPTMHVPDELRGEPRLSASSDGTKKNLVLESVHGSINADVWIVSGASTGRVRERPASMVASSTHGSLTMRLHADCSVQPFSLLAKTKHGSVNVSIPPSFIGPVKLKTVHSSIILSSAAKSRLTIFSDVSGVKTCFVGDHVKAGYGNSIWDGPFVELDCVHGRMKLSFMDESEDEKSFGPSRFWKMFGL